jgi:hypothetical protein
MNSNLVSIDKLKRIARQKGLMKYIKEIGYSKVKDKKYFIKTIDDKKVNFGYNKMADYLTHHDEARRKRFKDRFRSLFEKYKNDYNRPIFWSYLLLW